MNTPSNAGKEHNPWDRKPHEYGAPEWRLLNTDEAVQIGDEYNYKDYRCEPRWAAVEHAGYLPISHTEYRRRATPPTRDAKCAKCGGKGWIFKGHGEDEQCDCIFVDPPTQSQEGETPECDAIGIDHLKATETEYKLRNLARRLTAAQRENDRLRSEVAGLKAHLSQALRQWRGYADGDLCADYDDPEDLTTADHAEGRVYRAAIKALGARAATEEGK